VADARGGPALTRFVRAVTDALLDTADAERQVSVWAPVTVLATRGGAGASAVPLPAPGAAAPRVVARDTRGALLFARHRALLEPFLLRPDVWPAVVGALVDAAAAPGSPGHNQPWFVLANVTNAMVAAAQAPVPVPGRAASGGASAASALVPRMAGRCSPELFRAWCLCVPYPQGAAP
jgi:hypothetical protein